MCQTLEGRVVAFIAERGLLEAGGSVLCALSGGADSVCLLTLLYRLGYRLAALHVNHNARGNALRDERFCAALCSRLGVPLRVVSVDLPKIAAERGLGLEEAGRELRYAAYDEAAAYFGADAVCTAHTADDVAETLILRLTRGTGLRGMAGIPVRRGNVVRPLLRVERADVEGYLRGLGQDWVDDETNFDDDFSRNKVRLSVLPVLRVINPTVTAALTRAAEGFGEDDDFLTRTARDAFGRLVGGGGIDAAGLATLHRSIGLRVVREYCGGVLGGLKDLSRERVESVLSLAAAGDGACVELPRGVRVSKRGGFIVAEVGEYCGGVGAVGFGYALSVGGSVEVKEAGGVARLSEREIAGGIKFRRGDFALRGFRAGDFLTIERVGRKKLGDFFTDRKTPRRERPQTPILTLDGVIVWVAGSGSRNAFVDRRFCVGEDEDGVWFGYEGL